MSPRSAIRLAWTRRTLIVALAATILVTVPTLAQDSGILRIREKALEFLQGIGSKEFDTYVKGRPSDFDRVYKTYHYLITPDKIVEVQEGAAAELRPAQKRAYELLAQFLEHQTILAGSAAEYDGSNNYLSTTEIVVNGEEIPLRDVMNRMAGEDDRSMRRQWSFAYKEFIENANVYLRQAVHLSNESAQALGYTDYLEFLSRYRNFDLAEETGRAEALIAASNDVYARAFGEQVGATFADLGADDVRLYDMPRVWAMQRFDDGLAPKKAKSAMKKIFESSGVELSISGWGVGIEAASLPEARDGASGYLNKLAQGSATVGFKSSTGFENWTGLLRECARMACMGRAGGRLFENHFLGDPSLSWAAGYLFENLMENPAFLEEHGKFDDAGIEAVRRAHAYWRLHEAREYAGRIQFLPQLYADVKQPDELYESVFEPIRMWGSTQVDRAQYMLANDEFECVARLRGMIVATGLETMLISRFGPEWFKDKKAGETLTALWSEGQTQSVQEFAAGIDMAEIDPQILVDAATGVLGQ